MLKRRTTDLASIRINADNIIYVICFMLTFVDLSNYFPAYSLIKYIGLLVIAIFCFLKIGVILTVDGAYVALWAFFLLQSWHRLL